MINSRRDNGILLGPLCFFVVGSGLFGAGTQAENDETKAPPRTRPEKPARSEKPLRIGEHEIGEILEGADGACTAIEIKRTLSPKLTPAFRESMQTLKADRGYYIIPEGSSYPLSESVEAISLHSFLTSI